MTETTALVWETVTDPAVPLPSGRVLGPKTYQRAELPGAIADHSIDVVVGASTTQRATQEGLGPEHSGFTIVFVDSPDDITAEEAIAQAREDLAVLAAEPGLPGRMILADGREGRFRVPFG